ncbi:MAG: DUF3626 domain-containing protein [Nakamurella sp.]
MTSDLLPVEHIRGWARRGRVEAESRVTRALSALPPLSRPAPDQLAASLMSRPVTLKFHPDRVARDGATAAESLQDSGIYRTQYETGTGAGSPTAYPGGDRERWEAQLFGEHHRQTVPDLRPRYGGLNAANYPIGACPRFGSSFLELRPAALQRATFCVEDSHRNADEARAADVGTVDEPMSLLAGLLELAATTGRAIGLTPGDVADVVAILQAPAGSQTPRPNTIAPIGRVLDSTEYIEAQLHGSVDLAHAVARIVIDPSFVGTGTGTALQAAADRFGVEMVCHQGFCLDVEEYRDTRLRDFRGPDVAALALRIHRDYCDPGEPITARAIGLAARQPAASADPMRQWIKQVWHTMVAFGRPFLQPSN